MNNDITFCQNYINCQGGFNCRYALTPAKIQSFNDYELYSVTEQRECFQEIKDQIDRIKTIFIFLGIDKLKLESKNNFKIYFEKDLGIQITNFKGVEILNIKDFPFKHQKDIYKLLYQQIYKN